jgi:peptidoglycan/LPS O-acetylase OafA/YrhL
MIEILNKEKAKIKLTGDRGRIAEIDQLRGVAILLVYLFHAWLLSGEPEAGFEIGGLQLDLFLLFKHGNAGVDLFFVLSGFCLFLPICKSSSNQDWNWHLFYKKRLWRIVPAYYAAIAFVTLLPAFWGLVARLTGRGTNISPVVFHLPWQPSPSIWHYATHLFFIHSLFPDTWDSLNDVFWSLGPEAQFYLVFPLFVLGFRRWKVKFLFFLIAVSISYRLLATILFANKLWLTQFLISIFLTGRWMQFGLGMLAAFLTSRYVSQNKTLNNRTSVRLLPGVILFIVIVMWQENTQSLPLFPLRDTVLALSWAILVVILCNSTVSLPYFFVNKLLISIGTISYSIFLIHMPLTYYASLLLQNLFQLTSLWQFLILSTVGLLTVCGISFLFYRLFERPFLGHKFWFSELKKS